MSDHLNYDEINLIIKKTPESLPTGRYAHYKTCEKCQQEYASQLAADKVLKNSR